MHFLRLSYCTHLLMLLCYILQLFVLLMSTSSSFLQVMGSGEFTLIIIDRYRYNSRTCLLI